MDDEEAASIGRTVMDGSWAKDLFRRAAQALHPDREPDPEPRQMKQERMCELLRARKQGDIMAMLSIYSEIPGPIRSLSGIWQRQKSPSQLAPRWLHLNQRKRRQRS
jgi:hypothetical protein